MSISTTGAAVSKSDRLVLSAFAYRRRGAVAAQVAVMLPLLMGMAALAVDIGRILNARVELQNAADAVSLAGAESFATDMALSLGSGGPFEASAEEMTSAINTRAAEIAGSNTAMGLTLAIDNADIVSGQFGFTSINEPLDVAQPMSEHNAVQITLRRAVGDVNDPLDLTFARVIGFLTADVEATATAAFDDRFAAYRPSGDRSALVPFVIQEDIYADQVANGEDDYAYDEDLDNVTEFPDGIRETKLFPYRDDDDDGAGSGNFGILHIGHGGHGTSRVREQIEDGITPENLEDAFEVTDLSFVNDEGDPVTYEIGGTPGIRASLQPSVETRVGDVVAFFLYSTLHGHGANVEYTITGLRFGRVMDVILTGPQDDRAITIQPSVYSGSDIIVDPDAPSTGGMIGRIVLVK